VRRVLRDRVRQRAIVTLKTGDTFDGVLWAWDREAFVLRNAAVVAAGEQPTVVDGELVVLAADVSFVQFP
jgi:small nuclear ribonucleoprotein (snRNP)-like protein